MTGKSTKTILRVTLAGASLLTLSACIGGGRFDPDFRKFGTAGFDTSSAALQATASRPAPDQRGIISYPGYQVAVARQGDTVASVAARVGISPAELASYNALTADAVLRQGEVVALPRRVAEAAPGAFPATGTAPGALPATATGSAGRIDVSSITTGKIAAAPVAAAPAAAPKPAPVQTGAEPIRHKVERGESAYSIARLYNVNVKALADWNGLGSDLSVREGQILMIPVGKGAAPAAEPLTAPGEGSPTPPPPSSKKPVPAETPAAASEPVVTPPAPDLGQTASAKLSMPVSGKIIRGYQKKKNDGIDIGSSAGTPVTAAGSGTVAAITKDTDGVPILVIRHEGNLLTVYANIDGIAVKKGEKVKRGQTIAKVRASDPAFLHFEVRQGFESVDPMPYLQ